MNRNERALKIAEYRGFAPDLCKLPTLTILGIDRLNNLPVFAKPTTKQRKIFKIRDCFSSFDGLMPIVCEILSSDNFRIDIIAGVVDISGYDDKIGKTYSFTDAETLIDALQQAIIFYYENR